MAETKTGALSQAVHPLIERARTSTVPIAALIGFDVEEIGVWANWTEQSRSSPAATAVSETRHDCCQE